MFDILSILPGKKKHTSSGWYSFNAVCCHHKGHKPDKRGRGGIRFDGDTNWTYNCFNCGFKSSFMLGRSISKNTRSLLEWCGIERIQIQKWNLESLQHKDLLDLVRVKKQKSKIKFKEHKLPDGELLDTNNPAHKKYIDYLESRAIDPRCFPFLVTPADSGRNANRIVVPFTFNNKIVGHTSRYLDDRLPKYINEQQPGYLFGYDLQKKDWEICILVEGIFDALSINGCALGHNTISVEQAELLSQLNKRIIFVPDHDKSGLEACDRALELGYSVSIPHWDDDIKDANDAVKRYGKVPTLLSILQSATTSRVKIEIQRKKLGKRI